MEPVGTLAPLLPSACALRWRALPCTSAGASRLRARIDDATRTDPLTGLLNRRALEELLEMELERATRADRPLSVIVGDIDGFAAVNERHGHAAGDTALQAWPANSLKWKRRIDQRPASAARSSRCCCRRPTSAAPSSSPSACAARRTAASPRRRCRRDDQLRRGDRPAHGADAVCLLRAADRATAAAKDLGSDRTVIYSDEVARTLARGRRQGRRRAPARHRDRPGRGARHPRHRHRPALAHRRPLRRADGPRARLRRGARRARAPRRRAARHREDRHLRTACSRSPARSTPTSGRRCTRTPRSARACSRGRSSTTCARGSSPTTSAPTASATRTA